jgi:hypothetical protein
MSDRTEATVVDTPEIVQWQPRRGYVLRNGHKPPELRLRPRRRLWPSRLGRWP